MYTLPIAYIGTNEILLILGGVVLLFGGTKLPQLAKGLGEGIREFKKSANKDDETVPSPGPETADSTATAK